MATQEALDLVELWETAAAKRALRLTAQEKVCYLIELFGLREAAAMLGYTPRTVREWSRGLAQPAFHWSRSIIDLNYRLAFALSTALGQRAAANFWYTPQDELQGRSLRDSGSFETRKLSPRLARQLLVSAAEEQLWGDESDEAVALRLAEIKARRRVIGDGNWSLEPDLYPDDPYSAIGVVAGDAPDQVIVMMTPGTVLSLRDDEIDMEGRPINASFVAAAPADIDWLLARATRNLVKHPTQT